MTYVGVQVKKVLKQDDVLQHMVSSVRKSLLWLWFSSTCTYTELFFRSLV